MTKFYKVEPKYKKSVYEYSTYESEDEKIKFTIEEMYRWGHVVIKVEDDEELSDIIGNPNDPNNTFEISEYEDTDSDDQCSFYFVENLAKGVTVEQLEEQWEEKGYDMLEEYGDPLDFWKEFHGELKITDVTNDFSRP